MDSAVGQPLTHQDNLNAIFLFKMIVKSSFGPNGTCKMLQNTCGGHVTITSCASRFLNIIKVTNPILKLIVSAVTVHLKSHDNYGLTLMLVIIELLSRSLKLEVPQRLILNVCCKLKQAVLVHLQDCSLRVKIEWENLRLPLLVVRTILCSKPACYLTQKQRDHISYLLIRGFLNGIPEEATDNNKFGNLHFVSQSGFSPDNCQLLDGLLVQSNDSKLPDFPPGTLKCALFRVSLSGNVEGGITEETWHVQDDVNIVEACTTLILNKFKDLLSEGVDVVACQKVVHPRAKKYLQDHGVLVLDRLGLQPFSALAELTGGDPIENIVTPMDPNGYGMLCGISVATLHKKTYYHLVNNDSNVSTLLLYNYHEESLEELKHVCHQGMNALQDLLQYPFVFCGGGCLETHLAAYARYWGKENMQELIKTGATVGQAMSIIETFARSLECVAAALSKDQSETLTVGENSHLWFSLNSLTSLEVTLDDNLQQCSCGAVTKKTTDPGLVVSSEHGSTQNPVSKWTESSLLEIQQNSLLAVDGALSKQNAIKTALEVFITILNVDKIIKKT